MKFFLAIVEFFITFCVFSFSQCSQKGSSFRERFPVIKITFAADSGASSEQQKRKRQPQGGRKRSITKSDDDKLVKRLKRVKRVNMESSLFLVNDVTFRDL